MTMIISTKRLLLVSAMALTLAGCGSQDHAKFELDRTQAAATTAYNDARQPMPGSDISIIKVKDNVFTGAKVSPIDYGEPLPRQFETPTGVTLVRATPMRLVAIASVLTQITKIPVIVSPDDGTGQQIAGTQAAGARAAAGATGGALPSPAAGAPSDIQQALNQLNGSSAAAGSANSVFLDSNSTLDMKVSYTGSLSGLLDLVCSHFNVNWKHINGRIVFSRVITRTFDLPTLAGTQDLEFNLKSGSDSSGGGSGGGSGAAASKSDIDQTAKIKAAFDPWKSIDNSIKQIVGGAGRYDVAPATGTITVTASPAVVQRVADYVETMRSLLSKQVALSVQVLSVTLDDADTMNNNMQLLFRGTRLGGAIGNSSGQNLDPMQGVIGNLGAITNTTAGAAGAPGLGWAVLNGQFGGTNAVVNALSQNGRVSVVTTASLTTINGAPVPVQVVNRRGYLASVATTTIAGTGTGTGAGAQSTLTPGEVTTGFNLQLVPRILKDGNLVLQYGIAISELVGSQNGFETFSSGGNTIQLPNVNMRNFVQQSIVPNGATLVLAGFEQVRAQDKRSGLGHPDFFQLGGSRQAQNHREVIVILITPTLLDVQGVTSRSRGGESPRVQEVRYGR
jgi:type IVB pilus formation R64 PilN family outer membrane protein